MRIGIDGREFLEQRTGVGRYLGSLCEQWLKLECGRHEFVIYSPLPSDNLSALGPPFTKTASRFFRHQRVAGRPGTWWEQIQLPLAVNRDEVDVFFAPAYSAPIQLSIPCVVTMHDVSFVAHPEWFRWREGLRRRWLASYAMRHAKAVITVSRFSKTEIIRWFDVPAERVHVIRHGSPAEISSVDAYETPAPLPLILYVGSIFNRRNLPALIKAFAKVHTVIPDAQLAIVGANHTYPRQDLKAVVAQHEVGTQVRLYEYVADNELSTLYRQARVFVFLSEYEGFGLPPLEALSVGVPIILGDTSVAHEIYGDASLFVPHTDVAAIAETIITLLRDNAVRSCQQSRATELLRSFSWERSAQHTLTVLENAARPGQ